MVRSTGNSSLKRRLQILDVIRQQTEVKVEALSQQFSVSTVTIRGDLNYLEEQGFIVRSFGSAKYNPNSSSSQSYPVEATSSSTVSKADETFIAQLAANSAESGDTLFLGASELTHKMVPFLALHESLSLIVNTYEIVPTVQQFINCDLQILGGAVIDDCTALVGPIAEQAVRLQLVNKCFIEFMGVNEEGYLTVKNAAMARLYRDVVSHAEKNIGLISRVGFSACEGYPVCRLSELSTLIVNCDLGDEELALLQQADMSNTSTQGSYNIYSGG
ncbi:DeoR/GlpR family DNA-binding transcription regulator [Alteromonas sp. HB246098]|uniref:DeoR/GlpR family DNA-binding transcription regulator n=1 Tax=Alteromonas portus TaxID=2565549 RepID=UPI001375AACE|nr:DeoR/GlpR family DNA-binding transcription regulator [Alteromonas portus]